MTLYAIPRVVILQFFRVNQDVFHDLVYCHTACTHIAAFELPGKDVLPTLLLFFRSTLPTLIAMGESHLAALAF